MRAVVFETFGDPAQVLRCVERPVPEPGPGEIRVRMILSPIHNHDLWTIRGDYGVKPVLPAIGGTEALGRVDALGEGVTSPVIGQRVTAAGLVNAWADYFIMPAARAMPVSDTIDDEVGCQLTAMPLSALMALEEMGAKPGQWIVQNAATGAVGKTLALIAAARGIHVINLVRRKDAADELAALGIGNAVQVGDERWEGKARALTAGAPIVAALDSVGGEESGHLLRLLGEGGLLLTFGAMSNKPMVVNPGDLIFKQATIRGFWAAKLNSGPRRAEVPRAIAELARLASTGALKLPVEKAFPLEQAAEAAQACMQPGRTGKIALRA